MNLVTGATGILGSHVVLELIEHGEAVIACRQKNSSLEPIRKLFALHFKDWEPHFNKIVWKTLNICDVYDIEEHLKGVHAVYHCAGMVSFDSRHRKKLFEINEGGTRNVVNACLNAPGIRLCHVSSIGAINNTDHKGALNEGTFWKRSGKESDYALSKYGAEREVWRGIEEGLNAVIVNPGVIIAPPLWDHSSSLLLHRARKGLSFYTSGMAAYVAASDVACLMRLLVNGEHFGKRFILIENNYPFQLIFSALRKAVGSKGSMMAVSYSVLKAAALLENVWSTLTGKNRMLSKAMVQAAFNQQLYSNESIKKLLNYTFVPIETYLGQVCTQVNVTETTKK